MSQEQALVVLNEERRGTIRAARNAFALRRQRFLVSWLGRLGEQWRSCSRPVRAAASRHGLLQSCARSGKILRRSTRRNRVPWQVCRLGSLNNTQRCLTLQSTGPTTAGQLGPVGGTRYIFANRAKPPCRSGPVTSNVRPLNTPSSTFQHTFGRIAFKHLQPRYVKFGPIKKIRLGEAGPEAMGMSLRGKSQSARLRPRQGVLGLRICQSVQDLKNDSKCHGRSRPKSLAGKGGRSVQAFRG